jgi:hypothetical protein
MLDLHGISQAAFDLIVASEVTSQAAYEKKYRRPTRPGGQSGVTIGIGYDVGQADKKQFLADWRGRIPDEMLYALAKCCGVTGSAATPLAAKLHDVVDIPWETALEVFCTRDIPHYLDLLFNACPAARELPPDCLGALLSIVFNRGASFNNKGERFAEMRAIRDLLKSGKLAGIPAQIRSMKRLWTTRDVIGLQSRREREAVLFEKGLRDHHPEEHAALPSIPEPVDPAVVARVQEQLKNLGYFQVGATDGSLTPKGKTEDAILAFRNKHGLPLTPTIDEEFLNALAKAQPPEVAEERKNATVDDVREAGSKTIEITDKTKTWAGRIFGAGTSISFTGMLTMFTDKLSAIKGVKEAIEALGITPTGWIVISCLVGFAMLLATIGVGIWIFAHRIEQNRLIDYRTGKNP